MKTNLSSLRKIAAALVAAVVMLGVSQAALAQTFVMNSTTLSAAVAVADTTVSLTSTAAASGSTFGSVAAGQMIFVDQEPMLITALSGSVASVQRRARPTTHLSGQTVYIATPGSFQQADPPLGTCTSTAQGDPWINIGSNAPGAQAGRIWRCLGAQWLNVVDGVQFVPATACSSSVSGNSSGTNGLTTAGTSNTIVMQASTSAVGTNTHNYSCVIPAVSRANASRGVYLADVTFFYGVQSGALGTQVATLASGTLNTVTVFGKITLPAAAASETASTVAPVRADAGTAVWTPVVASFNTATTTAGAFYSEKLAPATAFALTTDSTLYLVNVTLQNAATTATITNTPGFLLHYYTVTGL